jgi:hypothetical protein
MPLYQDASQTNIQASHTTDQPSPSTELVDAQHTPYMRKGLLWSEEEVSLLVKLREEQNLAWSEVTRQFAQKSARRSKGSIQVYWSTCSRNSGELWRMPRR